MVNFTQLKLSFYGGDITGSTDAMEALVVAGLPTVLFLEPPTLQQVTEKFPHIQAVGLAGMSRTMTPQQMASSLPEAFNSLKQLGAPITHYKVCSTFDSSPSIGSIGQAIEIGMEVFQAKIVPVAIGAPKLKRFVVFGNHFATINDVTYRLVDTRS
jgi:3-oxoisoapionate kinase